MTRWLARRLGRWVPARVAGVFGGVVVGLLFLGFLHGVVYESLIAAANKAFKAVNGETSPGVAPPRGPELSGGPGSLVSWASLGNKGRAFIAGDPTTAQLEAFSGEPALQPVRVYVGLESAPTLEDEAALAVEELERAGGDVPARRLPAASRTRSSGGRRASCSTSPTG